MLPSGGKYAVLRCSRSMRENRERIMVKKAAQATPNRQLRAARKERGWTQQQVADRIGAPLSLNVSRWENGTAFPSAYYIERLCQLFGKSVRELGLSQLEGETQGEQEETMTGNSLASTSTYEAGYRAELMTFRNDTHTLSDLPDRTRTRRGVGRFAPTAARGRGDGLIRPVRSSPSTNRS
jgi:transcriptional regulator with XRE-family HTH domain